MARTISIGAQRFEDLRLNGYFYVDKTAFVREWWLGADIVTLVCRPRRFGKTLNLDTVRCFLSTEFAGRGEELFGGLSVWDGGTPAEREAMRALQGSVPVVALSFANVKEPTFAEMLAGVREVVVASFDAHAYLYDWEGLTRNERMRLEAVRPDMDKGTCARALNLLCDLLRRYHGVRPVVLLDEYDTPMERAWEAGFWDEASDFMCQLMSSTFKTNPAMGRGLICGVTHLSREPVFGDPDNLTVVTASTPLYQTSFGFTQAEVDDALAEYGLESARDEVVRFYDGFVFDGVAHVYNPWSVTKFLQFKELRPYWANTSGNGLVSEVVRQGGTRLKADFEELMRGGTIERVIDEQVGFLGLRNRADTAWALLLAAGYVTSPGPVPFNVAKTPRPLRLTNHEVGLCFDRMAEGWFAEAEDDWDDLATALLAGDARTATKALAALTLHCMSSFDGAIRPAEREPGRFYHGLVLGLLARLRGRWSVESNRESGWGRYDVALVPTDGANGSDPAVVMEFKVFDAHEEQTLADTVARARAQIEDKAYVAGLVGRGIDRSRIRTFGIAFRGREVLVG